MCVGSIYCTLFLLDCFDFPYGCICISVYSITLIICLILQLPFVWGSSLFSHFCIFVSISLNAIRNHLWNLCSWPEIKPWAFGVGTLTPRPYSIRELTLELSNSENSHKGNHLKHHSTTSSTLGRMPHLNNKQTNIQIQWSAGSITTSLSLAHQKKNNQIKTQHKSHPMWSLHKRLDQP